MIRHVSTHLIMKPAYAVIVDKQRKERNMTSYCQQIFMKLNMTYNQKLPQLCTFYFHTMNFKETKI